MLGEASQETIAAVDAMFEEEEEQEQSSSSKATTTSPPTKKQRQERTPEWEPLRLRASGIAACVGVHPYAEVDEVWTELIYQGARGALALEEDAAAVGAVVETKDEAARRVLERASAETKREVLQSLKAAATGKTVGDVAKVSEKACDVLAKAVARKELRADEAADLKSHVLQTARTEFGTGAEDKAIAEYERRTGRGVTHKNDQLLVWTPPPSDEEDSSSDSNPPSFTIVGMLDGMAYEVDDSDDVRPVVVEIKHRVSKLQQPQRHDELQVVMYALLSGADRGDLVQCLRHGSSSAAEMRIDRVNLADHLADLRAYVFPRLRDLVRNVDAVRRDPDRRRQWLLATPYDRWDTAARLCAWCKLPPPDYRGAFSYSHGDPSSSSPVCLRRRRRRTATSAEGEPVVPDSSSSSLEGKAVATVDAADVDPAVLDELPPDIADDIRRALLAAGRHDVAASSRSTGRTPAAQPVV